MKRLINSEEATTVEGELRAPCSDCPWARHSLNGWLGGMTADEWLATAHGESSVECHAHKHADDTRPRCAGMAIYRSNVGKQVRDASEPTLPGDVEKCFATPTEFKEHHED